MLIPIAFGVQIVESTNAVKSGLLSSKKVGQEVIIINFYVFIPLLIIRSHDHVVG